MTVNELPPPWARFPGADPSWSGWRQGASEAWLLATWLPFWHALSAEQRARYLERWPPPNEEWQRYVTVHWG